MKKLNKAQKQILKHSILKAVNITCYVITGLSIALFTLIGVKSCADKQAKDYSVATTPVISETLNEKRQVNGASVGYPTVAEYDKYLNGRTFYFNPTKVTNDYISNGYWDEFLQSTSVNTGFARVHYPRALSDDNGETYDDYDERIVTVKSLTFDGWTRFNNSNSQYNGSYIPRLFVNSIENGTFTIDVGFAFDSGNYDGTDVSRIFDIFYIEFLRLEGNIFYDASIDNYFRNSSITDAYDLLGLAGFEAVDNYVDLGGLNYQFYSTITPMAYLPLCNQSTAKLYPIDNATILNTYFGYMQGGLADSKYFLFRLFDGDFYCNGNTYHYIDVYLVSGLKGRGSSAEPYVVPDFISYDTTMVARNIALDTDNTCDNTQIGSTQWLSPVYQNIVINGYYDVYNATLLKYQTSSTLTLLDLLTTNTLIPLPDDDATALSGIFGLLAQAFKSASSFFSVQIFPNITIGTLFFVPFVISIVFTIVWLFKR